jgi:hypothetical protein
MKWRTIQRGKKWRETSGSFIIETRTDSDYGPGTVYLLLQPQQGWEDCVFRFCGKFDTLDEAKAAAEVAA